MGLIVENLTFGYRCFPVLKGVDFPWKREISSVCWEKRCR